MLCLRYLQSPKRWFTHYNIERRKETYMNKKEVLELKRRFKKDAATFARVCGCYVDGNHNKICKFGNTFLNLEEDEYYKYLEQKTQMNM